MEKKFRFWTTFFTLTFAAIFFAACGGEMDEGVSYVKLTGMDGFPGDYKISEYNNKPGEYFTEGYIYNKDPFGIEIAPNNENEDAAAEFKIVASSLRIEIYEGQTLPIGNLYVYSKDEELIGRIRITKTNDKPKFNYEEYDTYWW
ncbi:MAG: hypothetical protein K2J68_00820 [Treponemataceae bacterium]|nr:hypothetical protein [Treponemataceae bacterium]